MQSLLSVSLRVGSFENCNLEFQNTSGDKTTVCFGIQTTTSILLSGHDWCSAFSPISLSIINPPAPYCTVASIRPSSPFLQNTVSLLLLPLINMSFSLNIQTSLESDCRCVRMRDNRKPNTLLNFSVLIKKDVTQGQPELIVNADFWLIIFVIKSYCINKNAVCTIFKNLEAQRG